MGERDEMGGWGGDVGGRGCSTADVKIVLKARCAHLREKPGYVDRVAILCTVYLLVEAGVAAQPWAGLALVVTIIIFGKRRTH